jgi:hypothetical protein
MYQAGRRQGPAQAGNKSITQRRRGSFENQVGKALFI